MKPQSREKIPPRNTIQSEEVNTNTDTIQSEEIKTNNKRGHTEDIPYKKKRKTSKISEEQKRKGKNTKNNDAKNTISEEKQKTDMIKKPSNSDASEYSFGTLGLEIIFDKSFSVLKGKVCEQTVKAIEDMGFTDMTEIQAKSLPHLLEGKDLVGSAKTGSGKTLAFLIPAVELIYKLKFLPTDGTGCIIISPTRELSMQTFGVLKELMKHHDHHTYGLLMGGANRKTEAKNLAKGVNIVVATPGRLLDHMQNTPNFMYKNLQCLVIDETDQLLDIGFEEEMKQIVNSLPKHRQTMLFSATQTDKVAMLTKLAIKKESVYVGVDDDKDKATVEDLEQTFLVCPSEIRFMMLYTFLKKNSQKKIMVFFSSCMSVKYHHELLNYVDTPVMSIYGRQKQIKRAKTFYEFCRAESGILLCTDVAARGLDIPKVDWIIQYDPPKDTNEYIHRVGRTARAGNKGNALLIVRPEEVGIIYYLLKARVPMRMHKLEDNTIYNIQSKLENLISKNYYLNASAKGAYKAYITAYDCHQLKKVYNIETVDFVAVAKSFGFSEPPEVNLKLGGTKTSRKRRSEGHFKNLNGPGVSKQPRRTKTGQQVGKRAKAKWQFSS